MANFQPPHRLHGRFRGFQWYLHVWLLDAQVRAVKTRENMDGGGGGGGEREGGDRRGGKGEKEGGDCANEGVAQADLDA